MQNHAFGPLQRPPKQRPAPASAPSPAKVAAQTKAPASARPAAKALAAGKPRFVDEYLAALLAQASHLISSEFHAVVRAHGFSVSEWRVLASLAGGRAVSIGELARVAVLKQPTVTRLLDRIEAKQQVERIEHGGDRRVTLVRITPAGSKTVARLIALARAHEQRVLEPFGLPRAEELKATLRRIISLHGGVASER